MRPFCDLEASPRTPAPCAIFRAAVLAGAVLCTACTSIPGETDAPRALQSSIQERVLGLARTADPQCKQQKISTTEMLQVFPDGRSAEELWVVESCGRRLNYVVGFPPKRAGGSAIGFSVRPER